MNIVAVILAAGEGKRMHSKRAKVLQTVGGRPLLAHVLKSVTALAQTRAVTVVGHQGACVRAEIAPQYPETAWVEQRERKGTGHALAQAQDFFDDADVILVLLGDVPLIRPQTLSALCQKLQSSGGMALLTTTVSCPYGYGRIVREHGLVRRIVEEKDATPEERALTEVNTGIMAFDRATLKRFLPQLKPNNAQGEYYLTDIVALCVAAGLPVASQNCAPEEVMGVNDKIQLAAVERQFQRQAAEQLLRAGATLLDPARVDIHGEVVVGRDVSIAANVFFQGKVILGDGVVIESNCVIIESEIAEGAHILSHSRLESCRVGAGAQIGPFARIRPQTVLGAGVRVGNFVETKASTVGAGSKINHLSYIGDATIGSAVNVGAGVITCNYDGARKHPTTIGNGAFIGSNSALVAPITIGDEATIGAGSTLRHDVAPGALALTRATLRTIAHWLRPRKE